MRDAARNVSACAFIVGMAFSAAGPCFADVIEAKNGQRLEGLITRESDKQVAINVDGVELTMERDEIAKVEKRPLPKKPKTKPKPVSVSVEASASVAQAPGQPAAAEAAPASSAEAAPQQLTEFPILVFDERNWKMGFQNATEQGPIMEFVPENETVQNWSELVTAQMFVGMQSKAMPVDYGYFVRGEIAKMCPGVDWKIIGASRDDAMYEWSIQGCQAQPNQTEIVRVVRGNEGMHVIHYAKKGALSAEERLKWIERLGRAKLVKK